jgi:isopentenyl-diphosphate delta-isomerase
MRQSRKLDHLKYSLSLADGPGYNSFAEFCLVHNCLPDLSWGDINLSTVVAGISLIHPVIINAITGGAADVAVINAELAEFARRTGAVMAVGSQFAGLESPEVQDSYKIVREVNPEGVFFANLGAHATAEDAQIAVEMIGASAIQIHLNVAQELIMPEGDRDFRGYLDNIAAITAVSKVPVIVKEVGCGIAREQALALAATGINVIDVGGAGGTNFMAIEAARGTAVLSPELLNWGIPTAVSTVEVASVLPPAIDLIVSGGIRSSLDAVKSLALGGRAVGIAGPIIKMLHEHGLEAAQNWFNTFLDDIRRIMLLLGARQVSDLTQVPLVITGQSRDWLTARGIDIMKYANR